MNYTESDASVVHVGTGHRMHQSTAPITTEVSAEDMNMVIWSLMEVLNDANVVGAPFNPGDPQTYRKFMTALRQLFVGHSEFVYASRYTSLGAAAAAAAAAGKVLRLQDGATYDLTGPLSLSGLRGFVGSAIIRWAGPSGFNGPLLDASENSGIAIGGGSMGEMILRTDFPSTCRVGVKLGGGSISTFQSTLERMSVVGTPGGGNPANPSGSPGLFGGGLPSIAVDGGADPTRALNDGVFKSIRVSGPDIGYQVSAPDHKWYAGTVRVATSGQYGWAINAINNARGSVFGTVFSESRYPVRVGHGIWGLSFHSAWLEGIKRGLLLIDTPLSEIYEDLSFYSCHLNTDEGCPYLLDLDNWRPGSLIDSGMLRFVGGGILSTAFTSAIRLHSDATRFPVSVQLDGFTDTTKPLVWSGNTSRVRNSSPTSLCIGSPAGGIARHLTKLELVTWPSAIPAGQRDTYNVTVPGVRVADQASVAWATVDGLLQPNVLVQCVRVSADDTVQIVVHNNTGSAVTPSALTWRLTVWGY